MITLQDNDSKPKKLSHKQWKALLKKEKRRAKRQAEAKQREEELKARENSPTYLRALLEEELAQKRKEEEEERQRILQHELWLRREEQAQEWWRLKKQREENERKRREEEEQRIREEWEAREKKEKEEAEQRKKEEEERKEKQDALLKQATANEKQGEDAWHNPILPARAEKPRDLCPFFAKVGVCRFGDRCSRDHPDPDVTNTLLFPGMYTSFKLEQSQRDEYDTDLALEFDDNEIYQHFKEFYNDVLPEFKAVGHVIQFKVCCNYEPHLRGNVYVQFSREDDAYQAMVKFNSRWYAGKQITCQFVKIDRWKNAICGLFHQKKCPKGKACNFLHVFRNPGDEFRDADRDLSPQRFRQRRHGIESSRHRRSRSRSPRYSRSRSYRRESHARSQSRSPKHHRSKSHRKRSRSQSRSPRREGGSRYSSRRSRTREESWRKSPDYVSSRQRGQRSRSRSRSLSRSEMRGRRSLESCSRELSPDHRVNGNSDSTADETNHASADVADNKQNDGLPVLNRKRKHKNKNSRSRSRSRSPSKSHKKHKKHKKHKHKRSNDTQLESDEDRNEVVVINSSVISTAVTVTATATSDTDNVAVTQSSLTL